MTKDEWKDLRDFITQVAIDSPHGGDNITMEWFREKMFKLDDIVAAHFEETNGQDS